MTLGRPRAHWRVTDSTNERARELAAAGAPHGTLVTADEQTAGRGRQGRRWTAPPGSAVLMSLVLREFRPDLPLAAAVAVCEACECHASSLPCAIKWPNDIWVEERKLAGILIEGRPQEGWAVLGIGLNVDIDEDEFPPELRDIATSLLLGQGAPPIEDMVQGITRTLEARLETSEAEVLTAWRARDALRGREVRWADGSGTAAGIDDSGALLVETGDGRVTLDAGEIHLLR